MPPLKPGFKPNPSDPAFLPRGPNEEIYPDREAPGLGTGAHFVYLVSGEGVPANECAVFASIHGQLMCWFVQSGQVLVGTDAIKRTFGDLVSTEHMHDPTLAIDAVREGCRALVKAYPRVRLVFAVDPGNGVLLPEGNDTGMIDTLIEAERIRKLG